jgi:hypothetical protein
LLGIAFLLGSEHRRRRSFGWFPWIALVVKAMLVLVSEKNTTEKNYNHDDLQHRIHRTIRFWWVEGWVARTPISLVGLRTRHPAKETRPEQGARTPNSFVGFPTHL